MEEKIKFLLNALFELKEKKSQETDSVLLNGYNSTITVRYDSFVSTLEDAALNWMLLQIESYLGLLTSRKCTNIKVWKTITTWNEFDVYFHIQAKGKSVPQFALKTYIIFPKKDECQFKLEDWSDGTRGYVNARIITENNSKFRCLEVPNQPNDPRPENIDPLEEIET